MSQDPLCRNVKAGALVHTGDIQGHATPTEGVTEEGVGGLQEGS